MINLRPVSAIARLYFSLAIPFLLLIAGTRLLLSEQFLRFEYSRPGFPADPYGFTAEDRLDYGLFALNYIYNGESINYLARLRLPGEKCWTPAAAGSDCALFSERELQHMLDVQRRTAAAFALAAICAIAGVAIAVSSRFSAGLRADILIGIRRGCMLTLLLVLALAMLSLSTWDYAFEAFHEFFFAEGSWRFPFSDSLIRLYPEQLFIDAALAIALFVSLSALLLLSLIRIWASAAAANADIFSSASMR